MGDLRLSSPSPKCRSSKTVIPKTPFLSKRRTGEESNVHIGMANAPERLDRR